MKKIKTIEKSQSKIKVKTSKKTQKTKKSTPKSGPASWKTTEKALTAHLHEDLQDAWHKIKEYSLGLGEQRVYASGRAIMFSKKTCFFFVRPRKTFLEVVVFLNHGNKNSNFKSVQAVSKTKYAHTFKLTHADQVEGELTSAILLAYKF